MIKVLLLSANPGDSPLNIDEEFRAIDQKIRSSEYRDHVELITHGAVRLDDMAGLLMRHKPHVVHFSGHGDGRGIALTGADGKGRLVPPDALANIFGTLKDNVRIVVLNACDSARQAEAIVSEIDYALGMSDTIDDDAAIAFAAAFYEALGYGQSVQAAFDLALVQLEGAGENRSLAKLHKRCGIEASEIVLVPTKPSVVSDMSPGARLEPTQKASAPVLGLRELQLRFISAQDRFPREVSFALAMVPHKERLAWQTVNSRFCDMKGPPQPTGWRCLAMTGGEDRPETVTIPAAERVDGISDCPMLSSIEPWRCWLLRRSNSAPYPEDAVNLFYSLATDACRILDLRDCGMDINGQQIEERRAEYQHLLRWTIEQLSPEECRKMTWLDPPHEHVLTTWGQRDVPKRWLVEMPCVFAAVAQALQRHLDGHGKLWPPKRC